MSLQDIFVHIHLDIYTPCIYITTQSLADQLNFPTELTTNLLFQPFVRPLHVRIREHVMLLNLEDIPVLVYKEFQAFIVEVRNKLHIYLIAWVHNHKSYIRHIHYQKRLALVVVVQTDN